MPSPAHGAHGRVKTVVATAHRLIIGAAQLRLGVDHRRLLRSPPEAFDKPAETAGMLGWVRSVKCLGYRGR
jgi:hypothetical protein